MNIKRVTLFAYIPKPILIREAPTCTAWITNRGSDELRAWGYANWLLGFIAGMATEAERKQLQTVANEKLVLWVDRYCKADLLHRKIDDGVIELLRELPNK